MKTTNDSQTLRTMWTYPRLLVLAMIASYVLSMSTTPAFAQHDGHDHEQSETERGASGSAGDTHEEKYAFEWGGVYELPMGLTDLVIQPGPDASIDIALVPVTDATETAFDAAVAQAVRVFEEQQKPVQPGEEFTPGSQFIQLRVESEQEMRFQVRAPESGRYALFTQHFADEFQTIFVSKGKKIFPVASRNFRDRFGQIVIYPTAIQAFGVKIEPVGVHTLTPSFTAPARVAFNAERIAHIGSAVTGRVALLPARLGDAVKEGDTLIVINSPELGEAQSDYIQKRTLAETALPIVDLARSAYERAKKLYEESQGVSLTEVQRRQSELQIFESTLLNARAALTGATNQLQLLGMTEAEIRTLTETRTINPRYTVRAPIDGSIIRRDITLGALVRPDLDALLIVADTSKLWVLVETPEMRLKEVALGSRARISLAAFPGETFESVVSYISADVNEATRTAQVRVEVDNSNGRLRPGLFAQAEIFGRTPDDKGAGGVDQQAGVLAVPDSSVQMLEGKPVVFVPFTEKPNTFLKRPVTLGPSVGGMLPVLYGLREGEPIVVTASFILKAELGKSTAKHAH